MQDLEKVDDFNPEKKICKTMNILMQKIVDWGIGELVNWCHDQDIKNALPWISYLGRLMFISRAAFGTSEFRLESLSFV